MKLSEYVKKIIQDFLIIFASIIIIITICDKFSIPICNILHGSKEKPSTNKESGYNCYIYCIYNSHTFIRYHLELPLDVACNTVVHIGSNRSSVSYP